MLFRSHRKKSLSYRGYLVANRNRLDHDFGSSRRDAGKTGFRDVAAAGYRRARGEYERRIGGSRRDRISDYRKAVALHAAHHLRRRRTLRQGILEQNSRRL